MASCGEQECAAWGDAFTVDGALVVQQRGGIVAGASRAMGFGKDVLEGAASAAIVKDPSYYYKDLRTGAG